MLKISRTALRILLNHFKWDKERLMDAYYDTNQNELFEKAGAIKSDSQNLQMLAPAPAPKKRKRNEECEICVLKKKSSVSLVIVLFQKCCFYLSI